MRAISILLVIVAHSSLQFRRWIKLPLGTYLHFAHLGVSFFFVISGFLITGLLLKEWDKTGTIALKRFYVRRAIRIFPPFYLYLAIMVGLAIAGVLAIPLRAFFVAAIYGTDYYSGPGGASLALQHTWSLSVEEQFYLIWPVTLFWLGKRRASYLAVLLIVLSPLSRVATYFILAPENRAGVGRMLHSSIDTIMFGCLLALLSDNRRCDKLLRRLIGPWSLVPSSLFLLFLDPLLDLRFRGSYSLVVGMSLEGISICLIVLNLTRNPTSLPGRVLNTAILRHLGLISYSLYIWQNIVTGEAGRYFPLDLAAVLACAELSYWCVERPALRLRERFCQ